MQLNIVEMVRILYFNFEDFKFDFPLCQIGVGFTSPSPWNKISWTAEIYQIRFT